MAKPKGMQISAMRGIPKFDLVENCTLEDAQRQAEEDSRIFEAWRNIDYAGMELRVLAQARDRGELESVLATLPGGNDPKFIEQIKKRLDSVDEEGY